MAITQNKKGIIIRCSDDTGVCILKDKIGDRQYIFNYNKIKGYRGEYAKEIDLKKGRNVNFSVDESRGTISSVELI